MFRITFGYNGVARSRTYRADSAEEAMEMFEYFMDSSDADIEFVGIVEVD